MATEAQVELYRAVKAHTSGLEITRDVVEGLDREALDRRIEAARQLSEWIARALELDPPASPEVQTPPPSSAPADQGQTAPSASLGRYRP
jgi:hypothetical protein